MYRPYLHDMLDAPILSRHSADILVVFIDSCLWLGPFSHQVTVRHRILKVSQSGLCHIYMHIATRNTFKWHICDASGKCVNQFAAHLDKPDKSTNHSGHAVVVFYANNGISTHNWLANRIVERYNQTMVSGLFLFIVANQRCLHLCITKAWPTKHGCPFELPWIYLVLGHVVICSFSEQRDKEYNINYMLMISNLVPILSGINLSKISTHAP